MRLGIPFPKDIHIAWIWLIERNLDSVIFTVHSWIWFNLLKFIFFRMTLRVFNSIFRGIIILTFGRFTTN